MTYTRERIESKWESMTPRERDALVATEVMFSEYKFDEESQTAMNAIKQWCPNYSEDTSAAWEVLSRFPIIRVERVEVFEGNVTVSVSIYSSTEGTDPVTVSAKTLEEAACKAALLAVMGL